MKLSSLIFVFAFVSALSFAGDAEDRRSAESWAHLMRKGLVDLPGKSPEELAYENLWERVHVEELLSLEKVEKLEVELQSRNLDPAAQDAIRAQIQEIRSKMLALSESIEKVRDQVRGPLEAMLEEQFAAIEELEVYKRFRGAPDKRKAAEKALSQLAQEGRQLVEDLTLLRKHAAPSETEEVGRAVMSKLAALRLNSLTALAVITEAALAPQSPAPKEPVKREDDRRMHAKRIVLGVAGLASTAEIFGGIYLQTDGRWTTGGIVGVVGITSLIATLIIKIINWDRAQINTDRLLELSVRALFPPGLLIRFLTRAPGFATVPRSGPSDLLQQLLLSLSDSKPAPEVERLSQLYLNGLGANVVLDPGEAEQARLLRYTRFLTFYFTDRVEVPAELSEVEVLRAARCSDVLLKR